MHAYVSAPNYLSEHYQAQARKELGEALAKRYDECLMHALSEGPTFYEVCKILDKPEYSHLTYETAKQFLPLYKQGYTYDYATAYFPEYFL